MADTQHQPNYQYTPSSSQSTRQILDSTSSTTSTSPDEVPWRPQNLTRKSSNYAEADARARAALADAHTSAAKGNASDEVMKEKGESEPVGTGSASASWKPRYGRKQSWNQQDFKREMHMATVMDEGSKHGFTEAGKET
jgi:hypothetical protein